MTLTGDLAAWTEVLDRYEARLDAVRGALEAGDPSAVPPFVPPPDLGRMPEAVVDRATQLLRHSREVERLIDQAKQAIHKRIVAPGARDVRPQRRPSRLDVAV